MVNLNYNHLHYFWVVATVGSIAKAARSLHVTPQTISGQIRTLEDRLGSALFERAGRKLALTETGRLVHSYAEPMFNLGVELGDVLEQRSPPRAGPLTAGVATGIEKSIACRLLRPAMDAAVSTRLICHEARSEVLVAALLAREIDFAVVDAVAETAQPAGVRNHLVGQSTLTFFGSAPLAERYRAQFPASLQGAPLVLPARSSTVAKGLAAWFRREQIAPSVVAEVDSPDLASVVCEASGGLFVMPTIIADEVERRYGVIAIGEASRVVQPFYVASADAARRQASVLAVVERAREQFRTILTAAGGVARAPDSWRLRRALTRSA